MEILTKQQAIEKMNQGVKIKHTGFASDEWMTIKDGMILTENGYKYDQTEFWSYRVGNIWETGYLMFFDYVIINIDDILIFQGNETEFTHFMRMIAIENGDEDFSIIKFGEAKDYLVEYCDNLVLI